LGLRDADGALGFGEAAPLQTYDGVGIQDVCAAVEDCREVLEGADGRDHAELLAACAERAVLPQALAAIDLALWDLAGRRAGAPVWRLLGAAEPRPVEVNAAIAAADRAGAAAEAAAAARAGFGCLKVKVGIGDDAGRLAAVRAAGGPDVAVRVDANGAWTVDEALASLRMLEPAGLECCEEPVHGLDEIRAVAEAAGVPVALDESAVLPGALDRRVCAAVCLKVSSCGGIGGLLEAARRARAVGYEVYLASTFDGPLGVAAALHAACVVAPDRFSGLATLGLFERAAPGGLEVSAGRMAPPPGEGLGRALAAWYGL
jgi:L-alanine-DL-glutamate epimerase-like enolase superfamily enzyme